MAKSASKTVVVKEKTPQQKKQESNANRANEPQQTPEPLKDSPIAKPAVEPESKEAQSAPTNQTGQKIDKDLSGKEDAYVTSDGRIMVVQMEEGDQIFAGEHGKNAEWFPKDVTKSWTKKS